MPNIQYDRSAFDLTYLPRISEIAKAVAAGGAIPSGFGLVDLMYADYFSEGDGTYDWSTVKRFSAMKLEAYIVAAEAAIAAGKAPVIASDHYLSVGSSIQMVCLVVDRCRGQMTSELYERCKRFVLQTIYNLENPTNSKWGGKSFVYSGWAQHDPSSNYFFSHLLALISAYLVFGGSRSYLDSRLTLLAGYWSKFKGGGSPEGTGYGEALQRLYECAMIWKASTGEEIAGIDNHAAETVEYMIHVTTPRMTTLAELGDQARTSANAVEDPDRAVVLWAAAVTTNQRAKELAAWWLNGIPLRQMSQPAQYRNDLLARSKVKRMPTALKYFAESCGHYFLRDSWRPDTRYITITCGPNSQAHDQDDQGSVSLWSGGTWLTNDQTSRTVTGVLNDPDYHNGLKFVGADGKTIKQGPAICPFVETEPNVFVATLDPAYSSASGIRHTRTIRKTPGSIRVHDIFNKGTSAKQILQWNTPVKPVVDGNIVRAGDLTLYIGPLNVAISILDWKVAGPANHKGGYRIDVTGTTSEFITELVDSSAVSDPPVGDGSGSGNEAELLAEIVRLEAEIRELSGATAEDKLKIIQLSEQVRVLENQIESLNDANNALLNDIDSKNQTIESRNQTITDHEKRLDEQELQLDEFSKVKEALTTIHSFTSTGHI